MIFYRVYCKINTKHPHQDKKEIILGKYYVIQVYTGSEKKAVETIKKNVSEEAIKDCFFVVKRRKKKYKGTWHLLEENCFPGYVFLESDDPQEMAKSLASLRMYARLLGLDKETFYVQPIADEERYFIDAMTNRKSEERVIDLSSVRIEEGRSVRIVGGPLKGFEGKVKKFDLHHRKAIIELNILGTLVRTDLGIEILTMTEE